MNGRVLLGAIACGLLLSGCGPTAQQRVDAALAAPNWEPGYFAEIEPLSDIPSSQRGALTERSTAQIQDVLQKTKAIEQDTFAPGCLHRPINDCLASLAQRIAVTDRYPSLKNYVLGRIDLDGSPIPDKQISFEGHLPGQRQDIDHDIQQKYLFWASVGRGLNVSELEVFLPRDPLTATSADDYFQTGAFEVIDAIRPKSCLLDKVAFYRNTDLNLKKTTKYSSGYEIDRRSRPWVEARMPAETVCGLHIEFEAAYGRSAGLKTSFNPRGSYGGGSMIIQ